METVHPPMTTGRKLLGLLGWLALCFAAAAVGGLASVDAGSFYAQLDRPAWAPPGWLFGPVWTLLYTLMAVAAWLVWLQGQQRRHGHAPHTRAALLLFLAQLLANALWSWVFFAWRNGALAMAEVLLLWCLVAATTLVFWRVRRLAGVLLLPYLAWVSLAAALTFSVWQRNPGVLG